MKGLNTKIEINYKKLGSNSKIIVWIFLDIFLIILVFLSPQLANIFLYNVN